MRLAGTGTSLLGAALFAASCTSAGVPVAVPTTVSRATTVPTTTVPVTTVPVTAAPTTTALPFVETDYDVFVVSDGGEPRVEITTGAGPSLTELVYGESKLVTLQVDDEAPQDAVSFTTTLALDLLVLEQSATGFTLRTTIAGINDATSDGPGTDVAQHQATINAVAGLWFDEQLSYQLVNRQRQGHSIVGDTTTSETLIGIHETLSLGQVPLPATAVGLGAIWTSSIQTFASGLPVTIQTRSTVTDIDEGFTRADIQVELRYEPGDVELAGTSAAVIQGGAVLEGTATWTPDSPLGLYELVGSTSLELEISEPDGSMTRISQSVQLTSVLEAR